MNESNNNKTEWFKLLQSQIVHSTFHSQSLYVYIIYYTFYFYNKKKRRTKWYNVKASFMLLDSLDSSVGCVLIVAFGFLSQCVVLFFFNISVVLFAFINPEMNESFS